MGFVHFDMAFALLATLTQADLQTTGGHQIIDGNCSDVSGSERVYFHHIDKMAFPLLIRSETVSFRFTGPILMDLCVHAGKTT